MYNNDIYDTGTFFYSKGELDKTLKNNVVNVISKYSDDDKLTDMSDEELSNLVYRFEKAALSCRKAISLKGLPSSLGMCGTDYNSLSLPNDLELIEDKHEMYSNNLKIYYKPETWKLKCDNIVTVSYINNVLKVTTPATFKRFKLDNSLKENYVLMNYVKASLNNWALHNNIDLFHLISSPCTVIILRKMTKFNRNKICDNDNMENGRIINTIFEALGYSDNALNMDLYSCFRLCQIDKEEGMEFIVMPRNIAAEYISQLEDFK